MHRADERMAGADVVFLDPDNGLQIRSCRYGARRSSKFVYWSERRALWARGHSIVVYQHLPRVSRPVYSAMRAMKEESSFFGADRKSLTVFTLPAVDDATLLERLHRLRDRSFSVRLISY
jgi:hypothetical protein